LGLGLRRLARANAVRHGGLRLRLWQDGRQLALCSESQQHARGPLRLMTSAVRHFGPEPLWGQLKTNAMLPNLLARMEVEAWADDGIRLSPGGWVAEGVWSNLVLRKGDKVCTPPLSTGILEGVTRGLLLQAQRRRGRRVLEQPLTRYDLYCADEVWVCSSIAGAVRVAEVDGRVIGL
jgi:branched-chain amino acid aminotransferase